ncbi:hypothetical protein [Angustibacter sp. Root456]|uniref:hypothetical protein n=1 Tax=Angustibacter sp. Root456 TaxID=1736539 RepID=UPI0006F55121|nr:hypothetical protein [Angustibacter sp. Root456]KQX66292.1 hypothetical protein ASD06_08055 [Angustibacter sp. Root456]
MTTGPAPTHPGSTDHAPSSWLVRAWLGVALAPVFFMLAFAVGEGAYAVLGYAPENADAPTWVVVVTSLLVLLVLGIPCAASVIYGLRCVRAGDRRGLAPLVIASLVWAGAVVLTVVSEVGNALRR